MGISRRSTFRHVFASCSDVSVGGVRESNESRTLSWWILGYADDFSILAAIDERNPRSNGEGGSPGHRNLFKDSPSLRTHVFRFFRFPFHPRENSNIERKSVRKPHRPGRHTSPPVPRHMMQG